MIFQNVELHNFDELHKDEIGWQLQRVPDRVRQHLNPGAQMRVLAPANCEIRFVVEDDQPVRITLSSVSATTTISLFYGDFQHGPVLRIGQAAETLDIISPTRFQESLAMGIPGKLNFSPRVVRLMMWGNQVRFHGIEGNVRPPTMDELPSKRYLAYGTSITHGAAASAPHLTYVAQTAWRLGVDLLNFGVGGSCHCEHEFADYFAARTDWDFATLAMSVNMTGGFTVPEFRERVEYMIDTVAGSDTSRPVACITIYPHFRDLEVPSTEFKEKTAAFRQNLAEAVASSPHPNVHLVEGPDILQGFGGLTTDMIHPSDLGMISMGEQLANRLRPLISQ